MKELTVKGLVTVEGMKFHDIEGGFGEDKKSMLAKEIAEIHGRPTGKINELINKNRKRFLDDVDVVDLKGKFDILLKDNGIYTQNALNKSTNIYLLSERGYAKLLKLLEDDLAWEKYDKLVDGYFNMRKVIKENSLETKVTNELTEMREEYNFFFEEVKNSYEELSERVDKIMNIQLNTMINIEKLANSFCMIAQAQANTIETKSIEPKQPKRKEDNFTISDIATELGLAKTKENAAMLNKILAEETVIVCEGKNKFPSPILPKDWYIKAKFTDKTTKEITHYVIWTAKGKEEIIKILKKHLPGQTKMKI